jgi:tetratricopeptide (TPR) repeat protein
MGVVYRGVGPDGTPAAVKLLLALDAPGSEDVVRRFHREATVRIDHPNVCRVLGAGRAPGGAPYIAFELLDGEGLDARLERGTLSAEEVVRIGGQVCDGLAAAHGLGIVHRDLKPSNLFLCRDGTVKLFDFGIALLQEGDFTRMTTAGSVLGTPWYLSPEQARGEVTIDLRTDVWSLGTLLYEALAGQPPFARPTALASMVAVLMEELPPLAGKAPAVPAGLANVIETALRKPREERWKSAEAFGEALRAADLAERCDRTLPHAEPAITILPGEHRLVAVLLVEGVSDLGAVERAVLEYGGRFLPLVGLRALGVFGGEQSEGDEAIRAAAAALQARPAAERVAVGSGRAVQRGAAISGAALDAAESGCALALDAVAVDAALAPALAERFVLRDTKAALRFRTLVAHRRVSQAAPLPPGAEDEVTIGREPELAQLRLAVDSAFGESRAVAVLVTGPPGIGKTRLRHEMERIALQADPACRVLLARGEPLRRDTAFALALSAVLARARDGARTASWPSLDPAAPAEERRRALQQLVAEADASAPWADDLAGLLGIPDADPNLGSTAPRDPQLLADRFRLALHEYFAGLCGLGPLVLVAEDLQWGDPASIGLLDELLDRLADSPFVLLATARPEFQERSRDLFAGRDAVRLAPRGLVLADAGRLAARCAGREVPEPVVRAIAERTAGNPLFIREIVLELRDRGLLDGGLDDLPLPLTVEAAVQSRLDHLPAREKDVCKRAAVYGRQFVREEVEALGALDPDDALAALGRKDLLGARARPGGAGREYRFRSTLVRDVAYRLLADDLRADLHRRAAAFLAAAPNVEAEEVAMHHERGGEPESAARWYAAATVAAERRGDSHSVVRCAERALALETAPFPRFPVRIALAEALGYLGRRDRQVMELVRALDDAGGDGERARVLIGQAEALWRTGRPGEALASAAEAAEAARAAGDREELAVIRAWQAPVLARSGRIEEAREALREAQEVAPAVSPRTQALVASSRSATAAAIGDVAARLDAAREAVALYRAAGDLRRAAGAESMLADALNRFGAYAEAVTRFEAAIDACRRVGHRWAEGFALCNLAYSLTMLGRPQEAMERLDQVAALAARNAREPFRDAVAGIYRLQALLAAAAPVSAAAAAERILAEVEADDLPPSLRVTAWAVAARVHLACRAPAAALQLSSRAIATRDRLGGVEEDEAEVFLVHADALSACGRGGEAAAVLERGRRRLLEVAESITEPAWRERFLRDVVAHRTLLGESDPSTA